MLLKIVGTLKAPVTYDDPHICNSGLIDSIEPDISSNIIF